MNGYYRIMTLINHINNSSWSWNKTLSQCNKNSQSYIDKVIVMALRVFSVQQKFNEKRIDWFPCEKGNQASFFLFSLLLLLYMCQWIFIKNDRLILFATFCRVIYLLLWLEISKGYNIATEAHIILFWCIIICVPMLSSMKIHVV